MKRPVDLGELTDGEYLMILAIRVKYRFGDVHIETRDGSPYRILKAFESIDFNSEDDVNRLLTKGGK